MKKILLFTAFLFLSSLPLQAVEKETVVLREWNNGSNIEYLEYTRNNRRGNLSTYTIRSVFGEMQQADDKGSYDTSISKFIMDCKDGLYRLNKTYFLNGEEFVTISKYDELYYNDKPLLGWKKVNSDKIHEKVSEILCN